MSVDRRARWVVLLAMSVAVAAAVLVASPVPGAPRSEAATLTAPAGGGALVGGGPQQAQVPAGTPECPATVGDATLREGGTELNQERETWSSWRLRCTYASTPDPYDGQPKRVDGKLAPYGSFEVTIRFDAGARYTSCPVRGGVFEPETAEGSYSTGDTYTTGGADLVSGLSHVEARWSFVQGDGIDAAVAEGAARALFDPIEELATLCQPAPGETFSPAGCPAAVGQRVLYDSDSILEPELNEPGNARWLEVLCIYRFPFSDDGSLNDDVRVTAGWADQAVDPDDGLQRDDETCTERRVRVGRDGDQIAASDSRVARVAANGDGTPEEMQLATDLILANLEAIAAACPASEAAAESTSSPTPTATSAPNSCAPSGTVTDHAGEPMVGLRVRLHLNGEVVDQRVTDESGGFQFEQLDFFAEPFNFDLANDRYEVGVVLRDAVEGAARFQIHYGSDAVLPDARRTAKTIEDDPSCQNDFAFADINDDDYRVELGPDTPEEWRSLAFSYQHVRTAWLFATEVLGITFDNELPLKVYAYCSGQPDGWWGFGNCGTTSASFLGPVTQDRQQDGSPLIQFSSGFSRGRLTGGDRPVNGEYHEVGHAAMSDSFGNLMPGRPDETNHAGYANPTSTDSWTEGFAEWFAVMVQRETVGGSWWLYPISGVHSIEDDRKPTVGGKHNEELSIAGVLVDMVDGSADYSAPTGRSLTLLESGFLEDPDDPDNSLYAARFRNDTGTVQRNVGFSVEYGGFAGVFASRIDGIVDPAVLAPGEIGEAVALLPPSVTPGQINSVRIEGFSTEDDDAVSHTPREVWDAIVGYQGTGEPGNGFVIDMSELYEALITGFPDEAAAIDQIFVNHGWYADLGSPGNGQYDQGEPIGVTSRDGSKIRTAPERDLVFDARLDTGAVASRAFVQVLYPEPREALSYAFEAPVDPDTGMIALAVPPPETGAVVRIVLRADGYLPLVLDDIEAATFWDQAEANGYESFVELRATLREGDAFAAEDDGSSLPLPLLAGAAAAVVAVLAGGGWLMRRRR